MESEKQQLTNHIPLTVFDPAWGSPLAAAVLELERLRVKRLGGLVPPYIFYQLKDIFQLLESLGSARIEGNATTISEVVEKVIETQGRNTVDENFKEIFNIDSAIDFIEENVNPSVKIDRALLSEIHKKIVDGLTPPPDGEGSLRPGELRNCNVTIQKSNHKPPDYVTVNDYLEELIEFVNAPADPQYDLLKTALAHHRMAWIHPFDNGNGRMVRMFTYAMLIKQGFRVKVGRLLNPTAIFCMDRQLYYDKLALADTGEEGNVLDWCTYVLDGLLAEIQKIDKLLNKRYLLSEILLPALAKSLERKLITNEEYRILTLTAKSDSMSLRSKDLEELIGPSPVRRSRVLKKLRDKKMLKPLEPNGRVYTIGFSNNYLLRGVMEVLEENGFVPKSLTK